MKKLFKSLVILAPLLSWATPSAPENLEFTDRTAHSVTMSWRDNSHNERGYKIFRNNVLIKILGKNSTSYTDTSLAPNTEYTYTIKATDDVPNYTMANSKKESYGQNGEPLEFEFYNLQGNDKDWLGIFRVDAMLNYDNLLVYAFTHTKKNGSIVLDNFLHGLDSLDVGKYKVVSFYNDSYKPESVSYFDITDRATINTTQDIYPKNSTNVEVTLSNLRGDSDDNDWVGIYKKDDPSVWEKQLGWNYTRKLKFGKLLIDNANLADEGQYEVRYFYNDGFDVVAKSSFEVKGDGDNQNQEVVTKIDEDDLKIYYRRDLKNAPVVLFLPGWADNEHADINLKYYTKLLKYIAQKGYYVIGTSYPYRQHEIISELDKAKKDEYANTSKVAVMGHSIGGSYIFSFLKDIKAKYYALDASSLISLDGWFAFDMTTNEMNNITAPALIMAFGGVDGIKNPDNSSYKYMQNPIINLALYRMMTHNKKKFVAIEAKNSHGYLKNNYFDDANDLKTIISTFLDYSIHKPNQDIPLDDNSADALKYIQSQKYIDLHNDQKGYHYKCLYDKDNRDQYNYCDLNNIISYVP